MDPNMDKLSAFMSEMGDLAIQSVRLAVSSFLDGRNTVDEVRSLSETITERYNEVGNLTFNTLLKYQPVASDFRFIRSSIEISHAFHRFGRYAYDITLVSTKFGNITFCKTEWLCGVSNEILEMIQDAVESFAILDARKARLIEANEEYVDKLYRERIPMLVNHDNTKCALAEALLLLYLERIGDHAVFMSRAVNYIVTGQYEIE